MFKRILLLALALAAGPVLPTPISKNLAELGANYDPIRLNGQQASYIVKIPVSPRDATQGAKLHLETVNSTALIRSRSALTVRLNGAVIAQYPLDPEHPNATHDIALPLDGLKPGYSEVEVAVVQHYTFECEDSASAELWTELNPGKSTITFDSTGYRQNLAPRLSQLKVAFDRRSWVNRPLAVVMGTEHVSEAQLTAAGFAVEGLALRKGRQPVRIDLFNASTAISVKPESGRFPGLSTEIAKNRDVVLIGRRAELSRYLDSELYNSISGAFVGVFPANGGDSVVVVVAGNTDEELARAAKSLADPNYKFGDVTLASITGGSDLPTASIAHPNTAQSWTDFGFRTTTVQGLKIQPINLEFKAPPDFGAQKGDLAAIKLHMSYGAGLRNDSSMVVKLNGNFAVAVPLSDTNGSEFSKYEIKVPAQFIKPGFNSLTFEPVFVSQKTKCDASREEQLLLTLYEDSTLELPPPSVAPQVPDLARFKAGMWPMSDKLRVYLTQTDNATATGGLELIAMLAQQNRSPFDLELSFKPFEAGHMVVFGPEGSISDNLRKVLPLQKYTWTAEGSQAAVVQTLSEKRVITAFLANNSDVLRNAVRLLREKNYWAYLDGKAMLIDTREESYQIEQAESKTAISKTEAVSSKLTDWRSYGLAVGLGGLLFAWSFIHLLKKKQQERKQHD